MRPRPFGCSDPARPGRRRAAPRPGPPEPLGGTLGVVTWLDLVLVLVAVLACAGGAARGLLASALGFGGFAAGAVVGLWIGPRFVPEDAEPYWAPIAALGGAALVGTLLAGALESLGIRLRRVLPGRAPAALDRALGGVFTVAVVLVLAWLFSAALSRTAGVPAPLRDAVRDSTIVRLLGEALPSPTPVLALLARFDPLPRLAGPPVALAAPDRRIARDPDVRRASRSVLRVEGTACGLGVTGTAWAGAPGLVVTNQHVVAGEDETTVTTAAGRRFDATAVYVDTETDIAVLRAPGLDVPILPTAVSVPGRSAAIVGHPGGGPLTVRAGRTGETSTVFTEDSYGRGPIRRSVLGFRGVVERGNSGGPLIDRRGVVVGTVFAAARSAEGTARASGYAVPTATVRRALRAAGRSGPVATGPCGSD